ncbi:MAG: outer membrane beta-barrel protein [Bacteroidia bacterium]|nr:outer membrane beta-barrel protein [Bacteroidia bacterium]
MKQMIKNTLKRHIKTAIILASLWFQANTGIAQNLYIKLQTGYQLSLNPLSGQDVVSNVNSTFTTSTYTSNNIGLGTGFNFGAALGYDISENLGTELGLGYLLGQKNEVTSESTNLNANNTFYNNTTNIYTRMFFMNPSMVFKAGTAKLKPYARFGLLLGIGSINSEVNSESSTNGSSSKEYNKYKINGGLAWGANGAFGLVQQVNEHVSIYAEVAIQTINYRPKKSEMIEAELNGNDILNTYSTRDKITEYTDKYTVVSSNNTPNPNKASQSARVNFPLSNVLFQIGVKFSMGK